MKMRIPFMLFFFFLGFNNSFGQVNLQSGTPQINLPIYSYSNNNSKLSFNVSLNYTAGNGIKVDDEASEVGLGWTLNAGGQIVRLASADPDDQIQKDVTNELHFKAGLFYPPTLPPNSGGEVVKLAWAPSYPKDSRHTYYDKNVHYDKEHDQFIFSFNGRGGKFILANDIIKTPLLFEKNGLKIKTIENAPVNEIVGSIAGFIVTDENGIEYRFENRVLSEIMDYVKSCYVKEFTEVIPYPPFTQTVYGSVCDEPNAQPRNLVAPNYEYVTKDKQFEIVVPRGTGYYIAHAWVLSEIVNPLTNEKIKFNYLVKEYKANKDFNSSKNSAHYDIGSGRWQATINITENYESVKYPELVSIDLPENRKLLFAYNTPRLDMLGKKALDEISYKNMTTNVIEWKYLLDHGYFYRSNIREENNLPTGYKSREVSLCLQSLQKFGSDGSSIKPVKFDYYTGIQGDDYDVTFRERFNYSKDHWGYNNIARGFGAMVTNRGEYISLPPLDEYLEFPEIHRKPSDDVELLQIGMIKSIENEYGGFTYFEYEPNLAIDNGVEVLSGGVRVKQIKNVDAISNITSTKLYKYILTSGLSSAYGYEKPSYNEDNTGVWIIPNNTSLFKNYNKWAPVLKSYAFSTVGKNIIDNVAGSGTYNGVSTLLNYYTVFTGLFTNTKQTLINVAISTAVRIISYYYPPLAVAYRLYSAAKATGLFTTLAYHAYDFQTYNRNVSFINSANFISPSYSRVEELVSGKNIDNTTINSGKTVYEFYSNAETPFLLPNYTFPYASEQRKIDWAYGMPKKTSTYDNVGRKITEKEFIYEISQQVELNDIYKSVKAGSPKILISPDDAANGEVFTNYSGFVSPYFIVHPYRPVIGNSLLKTVKERTYNPQGDFVETVSNMDYNPVTKFPNYLKKTDSKGTVFETKTYFNTDYAIPGVLNDMVQKNIIAQPVSTETWQTKPGIGSIPEMLSTSVTEFGMAPNGDYKPIKSYSLETDRPVSQNQIGVFNPNQLIRDPSLIKQQSELAYDGYGNNISIKNIIGNLKGSTLFGYNNAVPVASISNAMADEVAYTSFEANDNNGNPFYWNWSNNSGSTPSNGGAQTGARYADGRSQTDIISFKNKPYKLSFWAKGNNFIVIPQVLLTQKIAGPTINGWTYYEYDVAAVNSYYTLSVDGNGSGIDELRVYPKTAGMATTTYDQNIGKTSECDINNHIIYYEYDGLGRLVKVLDERRNIIKTYEYHFKN